MKNDSFDILTTSKLETIKHQNANSQEPNKMNGRLRVLTVGDGDLSLSLALIRAYGDRIELSASVLDSETDLFRAFPDAPRSELQTLKVPIHYGIDATQLHLKYKSDDWDLILFHHPHLGLATLGQDEANHAQRHYSLLCHYLNSASQVAKLVHVCLCGNQPDTWKLLSAADRQGLELKDKLPTTAPFCRIWTDEIIEALPATPEFAAPRKFRNGKLGSRHHLGKYGYCHRRTAGEKYSGMSADMNVAGSFHFVFTRKNTPSTTTRTRPENADGDSSCSICGNIYSSFRDLNQHLNDPARPQLAHQRNLVTTQPNKEVNAPEPDAAPNKLPKVQKDTMALQSLENKSFRQKMRVTDESNGKRLRWFLQRKFAMSKKQADAAAQTGNVFIDGEQVLDSSRFLKSGTEIGLLEKSLESKPRSTPCIEITHKKSPFTVVWKPSGMRTKGTFPGTLEHSLMLQEKSSSPYESLSKLDSSCPGLCVMMTAQALKGWTVAPLVTHHLIALVHGQIPNEWSPNHKREAKFQKKWKKRKHAEEDHAGETTTITLIPRQRTGLGPDKEDLDLSTLEIQTTHPSSASICQWLRREGYPVVGDTKCRQEYLKLKRSIRNRIKEKLCIGCYRVQWDHDGTRVKIPAAEPPIPDRLSALYWVSNFGTVKSPQTA